MLKKISQFLTIVIFTFLGILVGLTFGAWQHYHAFEDLYASQSTPWYFHLVGYCAVCVAVVVLATIAKVAIHGKRKEKAAVQKYKDAQAKEQTENKPDAATQEEA